MTEQRKNAYEDDDLKQIVEEVEDEEAEIKKIMASAMGKAAGHRKKIKGIKKRAKSDLQIPSQPLNALLKARKLQKQLDDTAADVSSDYSEVFEDMVTVMGAFGDTPLGQSAIAAAKKRKTEAEKLHEEEQAEGEKILDELTGNKAVH